MTERFHDIPEHIRDSFERVYDQFDHLISDLKLTDDYFMMLAASAIMPPSYNSGIWQDEFDISSSFDGCSYLERRADFMSNLDNEEKHSYTWSTIINGISVDSLMQLDSTEDNMGSWYWYNMLAEEEQRIRKFIWPELYPEPVMPHYITYTPRPTPVVTLPVVAAEVEKPEPRTDVSEMFGSKDNLFDWIKEQGNSAELTEEMESWKAKKSRLPPNRKRNQIIITNIIKGVCERHLFILAQRIGMVVDIYFPINKITQKQEYAFIEFKSPESVQIAIKNLHGSPLGRQRIFVDIPKTQ